MNLYNYKKKIVKLLKELKIFNKLNIFKIKLLKKKLRYFFTGHFFPLTLSVIKLKQIITRVKNNNLLKKKIKIALRAVNHTTALKKKILTFIVTNTFLNRSLQQKFDIFTIIISPVETSRMLRILNAAIRQLRFIQTILKCVVIDVIGILSFLAYIRATFLNLYFSNAQVTKAQKQKILLAYQHALKVQEFYFNIMDALVQTEKANDKFIVIQRRYIQFKVQIPNLTIGVEPPTFLQLLTNFLLDHFLVKGLTEKQLKYLDLSDKKMFVVFDKKTGRTRFFNLVTVWRRSDNMNHLPSNKLADTCDFSLLYRKSRETGHHLISRSLIKRLIAIAKFLRMNTVFITVPTKSLASYKNIVRLKSLDKKKTAADALVGKIKTVVHWVRYRMNVLFNIFEQKNLKIEIFDWESLLSRRGAYTRELASTVDEVMPKVVDFYQLKAKALSKNDLFEKIILPQDFINFLLNHFEQKQQQLSLFRQALVQIQTMTLTCPDELEFEQRFDGFKFNWVCDAHQKKIDAIFIQRYPNVPVCLRDKKPEFVRDELIQKFQKQSFLNYDNRLEPTSKNKFFISSMEQLKQNGWLLPFESLDIFYQQIKKFNFFNHNFFILVRVFDEFLVKQNSSAQLITNYNKALTNGNSTETPSNRSKFFLSGFTVLKVKKLLLQAVKNPKTFINSVVKPLINTVISSTYDDSYFSTLWLVVGITQPNSTHTLTFISIGNNNFTLNSVVTEIASILTKSDGYVTFLGFVSKDKFSISKFNKSIVEENNSTFKSSTMWRHSYQIKCTDDFKTIINRILLTTNLYSNIELHFLQHFFIEFKLIYKVIFQNAYIEFQKHQQTLAFPSNEIFLEQAKTNHSQFLNGSTLDMECVVFIQYSGQYLTFYSRARIANDNDYDLIFVGDYRTQVRNIFILYPDAKVVGILHLEYQHHFMKNYMATVKKKLIDHKLFPQSLMTGLNRSISTFYYNFFNHLENKSVTNSVIGLFCETAHHLKFFFALEPSENLKFYTKTMQDKYSKPIKK